MVLAGTWQTQQQCVLFGNWKEKQPNHTVLYMMTLTYCSTVLVLNYAAPVAKVLSHTDKKRKKNFPHI
jgi:hypothetical protein